MPNPRPKRAGRKARHIARAAGPPTNPAPPGQPGGTYKPLNKTEIQNIYDTALRLLSDLGMGEVPDRLRQSLEAAGALSTPTGRVAFPRGLVEDAITAAPKTFPLHARDPARSIEVGGDAVHFGTGGAAVQTLDMGTGLYRASTLEDLHNFTRLQDALTNISWFTRCCIATDVEGEFALDVNTAYALMRNTTKPVATAFTTSSTATPRRTTSRRRR